MQNCWYSVPPGVWSYLFAIKHFNDFSLLFKSSFKSYIILLTALPRDNSTHLCFLIAWPLFCAWAMLFCLFFVFSQMGCAVLHCGAFIQTGLKSFSCTFLLFSTYLHHGSHSLLGFSLCFSLSPDLSPWKVGTMSYPLLSPQSLSQHLAH